ncbi:hypothetical protein JOY44_25220 (plasmid) [Phormidium sp. CLA17]|uniref:hypothetical protein n=1 Tax=Leptolyngbya sp. Cla-17 TaxID=2803751 RepID=UPI0019326043|nr:hypothetical protein [Leptolyngbya sp. Cla-17]MBM0744830.1 hypothetical protein [Leptolyngbya sp. Cla-17]
MMGNDASSRERLSRLQKSIGLPRTRLIAHRGVSGQILRTVSLLSVVPFAFCFRSIAPLYSNREILVAKPRKPTA